MKKFAFTFGLIGLTLTLFLSGCSTTWQDATGKSLATIDQTVAAAMKGWETYSVAVKLPDNDPTELKVQAAYVQYQAAFQVALTAYTAAVTTQDQTILNQALAALTASEGQLLTLVKTVTQ